MPSNAPPIPPMPTVPTAGKAIKPVGKVGKPTSLPPCPPGFSRKTDNGKRVEALVALSELMIKLPEIQDDPIELIRYIDHVCIRRKANLITSPMLAHLGVDTLGSRLEDYPAPILVMILGFLYEGTCVEDPVYKGCQSFESLLSPDIHVVNRFNPSHPTKMGCGEKPNYLHTLSWGFKSHEEMVLGAQYMYTPEMVGIGMKCLGFRENPKDFRTSGEYEMKVWWNPTHWREQQAWLESVV